MKKSFVLGAFLVALLCGAAFAAEEEIVAKIGDDVITMSEVDKLIETLDPQMSVMYNSPEGRAAITEELINARLFVLKGKDEGTDKSPEYLKELDNLKDQILMKVTIDKLFEGIVVSDDEAKKFYEENPGQFSQPEQIRARHILVSDDAEMKKVTDELATGAKFEDVAQKYSTCPSKAQGGDLGFFGKGQMVPEFEKAAFELEPGKVSEPVKTQFGVHVIRVEEKKASSAVPYDDVKDQLKSYLLNQKRTDKYQQELKTLKEKYKVERVTPPVSEDKK